MVRILHLLDLVKGLQASMPLAFQVHTPSDRKFRVVVTKSLPGDRWLQVLLKAGCQVDICKHSDTILSQDIIKKLISAEKTHAVLGQLTEVCKHANHCNNCNPSSFDDATGIDKPNALASVFIAAMGQHFV